MAAGQVGKHKLLMAITGFKKMERRAADNKYLHKDFHQSMNILLIYILDHYGKEKLTEYLREYAQSYHKPLHDQLSVGNLKAMADYLKDIYEKEEWSVNIQFNEEKGEIWLDQSNCPAMAQIKLMGEKPCDHYYETYKTVFETICEGTPFRYQLISFDLETGACKQIFSKRQIKN